MTVGDLIRDLQDLDAGLQVVIRTDDHCEEGVPLKNVDIRYFDEVHLYTKQPIHDSEKVVCLFLDV